MNYIEYLQNQLGSNYAVYSEVKQDADTSKNVAILTLISGTNYSNSIVETYSLQILTNEVVDAMDHLRNFTFLQNEKYIKINGFDSTKQLMNQPVNMSNFMMLDENYKGTIQINITLIYSLNSSDIKEVTIDGEKIDIPQFTISYQTEVDNQKISGSNLNKSNITKGNLLFSINKPSDYSSLTSKLHQIVYGMISGNTDFNLVIKYTNNEEYSLNVKLQSLSFNSEKSTTPMDSITLIL